MDVADAQPKNSSGGRVLVTGGSGFLGRHVLEVLAERGFRDVVAPRRVEGGFAMDAHVSQCPRMGRLITAAAGEVPCA